MWKLSLLLVLCALSSIEAQSNRDYCESVFADCQRFTPRIGRFDETIDSFNRHCRRERRGRWNNVSRCEMEKATCLLILQRCDDMSCKNIAEVLEL
ncbi:uncharacterized protein LOC108096189 [Drosophila ficusphila]|uniref:uncharacterized protein LOC108096189 n=1 Tax=Drosophila ficusphila TaxID=30025 RepID=UPI0007E6BD09|nr:uncharacterized protein LOC108096189 [Drosophila ficusphila]